MNAITQTPRKRNTTRFWRRKMLYRRLGVLGVSKELVEGKSVGDIQRLIRPYYRDKLRQYHPDRNVIRLRESHGGRAAIGTRLQIVVQAYKWIMRLPADYLDEMTVLIEEARQLLRYDTDYCAVPFALERRPITLGEGYQFETRHLGY